MRLFRPLALVFVLALLVIPGAPAVAQPSGFVDELAVGGVAEPTALAFLPDGRMLIASKGGRLLIASGGSLAGQPAIDLGPRMCTESERGLLGVAVDPQFASNGFIYLYYTRRRGEACTRNTRATDPVNRVSRFVLADGRAGSEAVLVDNIPSPNGNHNAGDLHFGKDGYLYISVGDGGRDYEGSGSAGANDAARDRHTLLGKILRITRDGAIPPGNPFADPATSGRCYDPAPGGNRSGRTTAGKFCRETFAWGLRNPYRFAFDPNAATTRFFINDVGQGRSEEIDLGRSGADYGWNCFEGSLRNNTGGPCAEEPPAPHVPPIFEYRREPAPSGQPAFFDGCASITGGAFVPDGVWPAAYEGAYLFGDYVCRRIFAITPSGQGYTASLLVDSGRAPTHMVFGPHENGQALFYTDYFGGQVRRVRYAGSANQPPTAALTANPRSGDAPLEVAFDASGSRERDAGDRIVAFVWDFGDGATAETTDPRASHTYGRPGSFTASVRARDTRGALSAPATAPIDVSNAPPAPAISAPADDFRFGVGEQITLRGGATDPDEGEIPGERLRWEVRQRHADHFHPYHTAAGASTTIVAPAPEDLAAVENSFLEVRLTATDALGRSTTITRELRPRLVSLSFRTSPPGLRLAVNGGTAGNTVTGPATVRSWPGYELELGVPEGQRLDGTPMRFCAWSQGGTATQTLVTPERGATYTAIFVPESEACPAQAPPAHRLFFPLLRR